MARQAAMPLHPGTMLFRPLPFSTAANKLVFCKKQNPNPMFISITYIKVSSIWKVPMFMQHVGRINRQIAGAEGVLAIRQKAGISRNYTITARESKEAMLRFRNNGAHLEAMRATRHISDEYGSYHYTADHLPGWKEAIAMVHQGVKKPLREAVK
jgi:hypothetical protein